MVEYKTVQDFYKKNRKRLAYNIASGELLEKLVEMEPVKTYTADEIKRLAPVYRGKPENFDLMKIGKHNLNRDNGYYLSNIWKHSARSQLISFNQDGFPPPHL
ncbi:hypothetical protein Zmor_006157 [Zophobas morio]|uniref:Uncharacterized protein n=1 Tax=Zophobas morio TaxID=2755281 RepID=A0AA38IR88_9CUCU|nr:hypothetical protein Zmor_006157 [Zophobas morio]